MQLTDNEVSTIIATLHNALAAKIIYISPLLKCHQRKLLKKLHKKILKDCYNVKNI